MCKKLFLLLFFGFFTGEIFGYTIVYKKGTVPVRLISASTAPDVKNYVQSMAVMQKTVNCIALSWTCFQIYGAFMGTENAVVGNDFIPPADQEHYDALGLPSDAQGVAVRSAYLRLARTHHPDKNFQNQEEAGRQFQRIYQAHQAIKSRQEWVDWVDAHKMGFRLGITAGCGIYFLVRNIFLGMIGKYIAGSIIGGMSGIIDTCTLYPGQTLFEKDTDRAIYLAIFDSHGKLLQEKEIKCDGNYQLSIGSEGVAFVQLVIAQ